jgi:CHAD domain-containing protein
LGQSLYQPHKTKPLHEMRIMAKRLRYALELFAPCWSEPLASSAKEIAKMQNSLGELHDCDVWIAEIGATLRKRAIDRRAGARHAGKILDTASTRDAQALEAQRRSAAIWLLDYFAQARTQHFRDALARWHEWEMTGFHESLAATINHEAIAGEFSPAAMTPAEAVAADLKSPENS